MSIAFSRKDARENVRLFFNIIAGRVSGDFTEHFYIGDRVAAQAVRTVNAAGHFSRRKEAGNRSSLRVQHFRLRFA